MEGDNVVMFELFHKGYFTDGRAGGAFFAVEVDFLKGDELTGLAIATFEDLVGRDRSVRSQWGVWFGGVILLRRFPRPARETINILPLRMWIVQLTFSSCWKELGCLLSMPWLVNSFGCLLAGLS